jgi:replicative DNA helicase
VNYPQAIDIEEVVLGAILLEQEAAHVALPQLNEECFFHAPHKIVFRCLAYLYKNNMPIDISIVTNQLNSNGYLKQVGGPYYVSKLTDKVASSANIDAHCKILYQKFLQRRLIDISQNNLLAAQSEGCDVFDLVNQYERSLEDLTLGVVPNNSVTSSDLHAQLLERNKTILTSNGITGLPSYFTEIDKIMGGWQPKTLSILAGRPGSGKSAISIQFAANPSINAGHSVAIFSLEMGAIELYGRMQSQQSGISSDKITRTGLTDYDISQLSNKLATAPIFIDDTPSISVFELRSRARKLKREKNIKLIIVDYLQLMTGGSDFKGSREQEIGYISRSLKAISKELNVPIIALSQLSRGVESRGSSDHRPKLSDLRESGSIEQDADIVMFIHRPEYFGIMQDANGNSTAGKAELIVAKHRGGPLADIPLNFEHAKTKFSDYQANNYLYNNY